LQGGLRRGLGKNQATICLTEQTKKDSSRYIFDGDHLGQTLVAGLKQKDGKGGAGKGQGMKIF